MKSIQECEKMKENLYWRLRDGMFAMDKKGEGFPVYIVDRVIKYAPINLLLHPLLLVDLVMDFGRVLGTEFEEDYCFECIVEASLFRIKNR